jgi:hypothetical protein
MISHLRKDFNRNFTEERYRNLLRRMDEACGAHVEFRISETPVFAPRPLMDAMVRAGEEILMELTANTRHLQASDRAIPEGFDAPGQPDHPLFAAVDFGITQDAGGEIVPRLIELQGFPTMFVYQSVLADQYKSVYDLRTELTPYFSGLTRETYLHLLRELILGSCSPDEVILLELDPEVQKTRVDFLLTENLCGIRTVNIRDVVKEGRRLFHRRDGRTYAIRRIYNRAIADELLKSGAALSFRFCDELDVEWAGHPNWFFRISKFSMPFLTHPAAPRTAFLSDLREIPRDLDRWVLKPLFSFAGAGVIVGPTRDDIDAIPAERRADFVLQEKVDYATRVESPFGGTKAEFRIMYFWRGDRPMAVNNLVRMGRGKMMGVDHNKNMLWVGSSAGLYVP